MKKLFLTGAAIALSASLPHAAHAMECCKDGTCECCKDDEPATTPAPDTGHDQH